jgi:hypothetical protein
MLPYARRIKRLGLPIAEYSWRLPETFSIPSYIINWLLSIYPVQDFLPRLTHISCSELMLSVEDITDFSFAPLSGSNLTSFDFTPTFDEEDEGWPLLSTLVDELPQLKVIRLTGEARSKGHTLLNLISQSTLRPTMSTCFTQGQLLPLVCFTTWIA